MRIGQRMKPQTILQLLLRRFAVVFFALGVPSFAAACNIPVFRYALERWQPDPVELVVFTEGNSSLDKAGLLKVLGQETADLRSNTKADFSNPNSPTAEHRELWQSLAEAQQQPALPHLVARTNLKERTIVNWTGDLKSARKAKLLDSPVRQKLRQRLMDGDAIVWLLLKSKDKQKNAKTRDMMQNEFKRLARNLELPDGIGEPGSELYADVPLVLQFSVLEIDPADANETYLTELLKGFHPKPYASGEPIIAPVFGRGRVLEVLPGDSVDAKLIAELTTFLCGACSCKVKGLNPGFDLLMSANWDVDLFGEDGERPSSESAADETPLPTLISIPPGRNR